MKEIMLMPSMMCANFANLEKEIKDLEAAGVDSFHLDVMDGSFVPNFGMGLQDLEYICKTATKLTDVHLMIQNPGKYIELFANLGADIIHVHAESDQQLGRTLDLIKSKGVKASIAINPATSIESIKPVLGIVDYIMFMTVNPGFAGQKYQAYVDEKIKELLAIKDQYNFEIMVDGAISPERVKTLGNWGVKGFILGTSALFGKDKSYAEICKELRNLE